MFIFRLVQLSTITVYFQERDILSLGWDILAQCHHRDGFLGVALARSQSYAGQNGSRSNRHADDLRSSQPCQIKSSPIFLSQSLPKYYLSPFLLTGHIFFQAIDVWMLVCQFFVFFTLVEFLIANYLSRISKDIAQRLDQGARLAFPISFLIFAMFYTFHYVIDDFD